jgi:hypothetical protein
LEYLKNITGTKLENRESETRLHCVWTWRISDKLEKEQSTWEIE